MERPPTRPVPRLLASKAIASLLAVSACAGVGPAPRTAGEAPGGATGRVALRWGEGPRDGWEVRAVEVDGRRAARWVERDDGSVTLTVPAGGRSVRLLAARRADQADPAARPERLRTRPTALDVEAGESRSCVVELAGRARPRPRLRCAPDRPAAVDDEAATLRAISARLARLEDRLSGGPPAGEAEPDAGFLEVAPSADLSVWVDGQPAAVLSGARIELAAGHHVVRVGGPDVVPYEAAITVDPGERVLLAPVLSRRHADPAEEATHGFLNLSSTPWAEVWSAGNRIGTTPLVMARLPVGLHRLTLVSEGRGPSRTIAVTISPNETTRCHAAARGGARGTCEPPPVAGDEIGGR